MKATLYNHYHQTHVTVIVPPTGRLSAGQTEYIYKKLCGMDDCSCSSAWGAVRGDQYGLRVDEVYDPVYQTNVLKVVDEQADDDDLF